MQLQVPVRLAVLFVFLFLFYHAGMILPFEAFHETRCPLVLLEPYSNRHTERDYSAGNSSLGVSSS